ncbi:hypothetical protein ACO0QE_000444 [Hanseniaspora vineae]
MSQGILYANQRIRSWIPRAICDYFKLDYKLVNPEALTDKNDDFFRDFPLKKIPSFIEYQNDAHPNAVFKLTEVIAVMYYLLEPLADEYKKTQDAQYKFAYQLLNGRDGSYTTRATILRWVSLVNSDFLITLAAVMKALRGEGPYIKKDFDAKNASVDGMVADIFEKSLSEYTYLTDEIPTLADFFACAVFTRGFNFVWGQEWMAKYPATLRWFNTVRNHPFLKSFYADFHFNEKPLSPPQPKKKEAKKKDAPQEKNKAQAAKKPEAPAAEAPAAEAKKPKHPLELLGKSTFNLDEWKREYSNNDTRPVALPWFWEHYNPEEYSIWKVSYKYNDELTLTFMSNNLVGGFINRLSGSVKYMFGCLVVYGENNNNGIIGAIMVRGQEFKPAFDVAPDWESYDYEKLDVSTEENKEFVNNMWAWDKPVVINGESKEIADGKVLK